MRKLRYFLWMLPYYLWNAIIFAVVMVEIPFGGETRDETARRMFNQSWASLWQECKYDAWRRAE